MMIEMISQYQEITEKSGKFQKIARYLSNMFVSKYDYISAKTAFQENFEGMKITKMTVDGATGCWGCEVKATNQLDPDPLPLLLGSD